MLSFATEAAGTRIRLKARRRCSTCPKVLVGRGPAQCSACRERVAIAQRPRRACRECGNPVRGRRWWCAPCHRLHALEQAAGHNRAYYARKRAAGWKDIGLKLRLKKLRDKTRKHAFTARRSPAIMRALRAAGLTGPMRKYPRRVA